MENLHRYILASALAVGITGAALPASAADRLDDKNEYKQLQSTKVGLADAIKTAESSIPGAKVSSAEFEHEDGKPAYTLEVMDAKGQKEVVVSAETGQILSEGDKEGEGKEDRDR